MGSLLLRFLSRIVGAHGLLLKGLGVGLAELACWDGSVLAAVVGGHERLHGA